MVSRRVVVLVMVTLAGLAGRPALAQQLGTFRWQLQPFCNAVTVTVTQQSGAYTVDGFDDQCGAPRRAPLVGLATPNPDGTIGFGLHIVTVPGGRPVTVEARISLHTLMGSWTDSAGNGGTFAYNGNAGGSARPAPPQPSTIPGTFALRTDGGLVAGGAFNEADTATIPATGVGVRTMWYPARAAFRAGQVTGAGADVWDAAYVGVGSAAFGVDTRAGGMGSMAFGQLTFAQGAQALAAGHGTHASGAQSVAFGTGTLASGQHSIAMGALTHANGNASFAMGTTSLASGNNSVAFGGLTTASGLGSLASGTQSTASGLESVAGGYDVLADGNQSVAFGRLANATGDHAVAIGDRTVASQDNAVALGALSEANGFEAVALGLRNYANGNGSVALGTDAVAASVASGSFVFSDRSSTAQTFSVNPNEFIVRAHGGTAFYVNGGASFHTGNGGGLRLAANGGSQWLALSDARTKHHFRDLDGDDVLARIAAMPVTEWSYKAQDPAIRHIGPTAQDFHEAFGLGEDPLRIGSADATGVALAAIRALEARTKVLLDENRALREALEALRRDLAAATPR